MMKKWFLPALSWLAILAFFTLPYMGLGRYWLEVLNTIGLSAILALSLNVILGHAGLFNMGHAAFFGIGAYVTAILNTQYGWSIWCTWPVAGAAAGLFALVVAAPIIHLRGDYLLVVTIGIVEIVRIALVNDLGGMTGGSNGITGIGRPEFFGMPIKLPFHFFYWIWGFAAFTYLMFHWLENARFGRALKYVKEDAIAAEGVGVNTARYKLLAFVVGATWAGFAGTIYASNMRTISPNSFNFWESVVLFMIVILGGAGNQKGVLLGAFLVVGLPELFRDFADWRMLIYGVALVVMMIFRPQGLLPPRPRAYRLPQPLADLHP